MDLIDRQMLMKEFRDFVRRSNNSDFAPVPTWNDAVSLVGSAPTAEVVEVVRCKECKYYLNSNEKCGLIDTRLRFYETDKSWTGDCFCAWGERREK